MGKPRLNLIGQTFGRLYVLADAGNINGQSTRLCLCEGCGNEKLTFGSYLNSGDTRSCGCKTNLKDLTSQVFGRLTVIKLIGINNDKAAVWQVRCVEGNILEVRSSGLLSGNTKSCGCLFQEAQFAHKLSYGSSKHKYYGVWVGMKKRCYSPTNKGYKNYGGRGIIMADVWLNDPGSFLKWCEAQLHYDENGYSLDRIDNDGPYSPDNCRFATKKEQSNNRRPYVNHYKRKDNLIKMLILCLWQTQSA